MAWMMTNAGRRGLALLTVASALVGFGTGCTHYRFSEASPSVRSFTDNERTSDYYVGFDLNFIVEQDTPHVPGLAGGEFVQ